MTVAPAPHLRRVGLMTIIASLAAIASTTLSPEPGQPLSSLLCVVCGSAGAVNAALNVLLFIPLGVGLTLYGVPPGRTVLAVFGLSILIETAQFSLIPGRYSTIGDVFTNTLGGGLGLLLVRNARLLLAPSPPLARRLAAGWSALWVAIQFASSFGFMPSFPDSQYFGQIARPLGGFAPFQGRVQSATIGGLGVPNAPIGDSRRLRRLLMEGAPVSASVVPSLPTLGVAPIVRVADARRKQITLVAQHENRFLFTVRTGAGVLRLRAPLFALPGAFPGEQRSPVPQVALSGRYFEGAVDLSVRRESTNHSRRIQLAASLGWTLWLPSQWAIEGTGIERLISALWTACLAIPLGFWFFQIAESGPAGQRVRRRGIVVAGALLILGFVVAPLAFGLPLTPARDWLAAFAGILVGHSLNARV